MGPLISSSAKRRLFIVSSVVLGCVLLGAGALSTRQGLSQQQDNLPEVKTEAESFQFVSIEKTEYFFVMRMQNISNKAITAYMGSTCGVPGFGGDLTLGDRTINPGEVEEILISVRSVHDDCTSPSRQPIITMTMRMVIFDDRSSEGDFKWAQAILDDRRGQKIQLKRINRLMKKALKWPDAGEPAAIEKLKAQISSLPEDEEESPTVSGGLSGAKQRVLFLLGELEKWHQSSLGIQSGYNLAPRGELDGISNVQEGFASLIKLNDKWISRY